MIDRIKPCLVRTTQQADEVDVQSIGVGELSNALKMIFRYVTLRGASADLDIPT